MKIFKYISTGFVIFSLLIFANLALSEPQVVFTAKEAGNWEIYLLEDIKKKEPINLTQHPANESMPYWSPDGKKVAFISDRDRDEDEIYTIDIETREVERITNNSAGDLSPDWCPKGGRIAYVSGGGDVYIADLLEKETFRLTKNMHVHNLTWTPDGEKLAFDSYLVRDKPAIYLMNPYGKIPVSSPDECEVIVEEPPPGTIQFWGLSFSPDQTMITFGACNRSGGDYDIYTMDLSTGEFFNLTPNSPRHDRSPCWSPNGEFIAFSSGREGSLGGSDIYRK